MIEVYAIMKNNFLLVNISIQSQRVCLFFLLITALFAFPLLAQQKVAFDPAQLAISFVVTNQSTNTSASFILVNNSKKSLPAEGWKIDFNAKSMIRIADSTHLLTIKKQKGNLFELSPATAFKGIAAGKECSAQVNIDDKVWNKNDQSFRLFPGS